MLRIGLTKLSGDKMKKLGFFVISAILISCSPMVVNYPSVCPNNDAKCQRNLDAQTLAIIGQTEAAEQLMRTDPAIGLLIGDCNGG